MFLYTQVRSPSVYLPPAILHISYIVSYMYHTCITHRIIYQVSGDGEGVILRGNTIKNTGNKGASVMDGTRHSVEGKTMGVEYMYAYVCVCVPYVPHSYYLRFPPSPSLPLPHLS